MKNIGQTIYRQNSQKNDSTNKRKDKPQQDKKQTIQKQQNETTIIEQTPSLKYCKKQPL